MTVYMHVAPRMLVKAVFCVSSTGCNKWQSSAKPSYIARSIIDKVLTNLLPAGLQDFFQVLNVSDAKVPESNSALGLNLNLGYSSLSTGMPLHHAWYHNSMVLWIYCWKVNYRVRFI